MVLLILLNWHLVFLSISKDRSSHAKMLHENTCIIAQIQNHAYFVLKIEVNGIVREVSFKPSVVNCVLLALSLTISFVDLNRSPPFL